MNGLIYVSAYSYDTLEDINVFLNDKQVEIQKETDYYSIFNENYYIVTTIRIWISKQKLIITNNKLDFIVGNNIYSYCFKVK